MKIAKVVGLCQEPPTRGFFNSTNPENSAHFSSRCNPSRIESVETNTEARSEG